MKEDLERGGPALGCPKLYKSLCSCLQQPCAHKQQLHANITAALLTAAVCNYIMWQVLTSREAAGTQLPRQLPDALAVSLAALRPP